MWLAAVGGVHRGPGWRLNWGRLLPVELLVVVIRVDHHLGHFWAEIGALLYQTRVGVVDTASGGVTVSA